MNFVMCDSYGSDAKQQFNIRSSNRKNSLWIVLIMYDGHGIFKKCESKLIMDVFFESMKNFLSNRQHFETFKHECFLKFND